MQNRYDRCPNCMQALPAGDDVCPYCGFDVAGYEEKSTCLKPFTVLQNKYMLGRVIGIGGFGITYIGWDLNLQTYIAIKEYYPGSLANRDTTSTATQVIPHESSKDVYDKGLKRYVEEAQNLSKFYQLQGIVSVKDFFYENGTGYIVMEYINGINLKEYLNNAGGKLPEQTVLGLMKPVLESLYQMHNSGLVHRDISPDNIMVDKDNKIKLIDFGSARGQSTETDKTYTVILKHGYAPAEQYYAKGNQGPWTDIYSLCATMYKMLTGQVPPNSVERMETDEYVDPSAMGIVVSQRTEAVLRKGLAVKSSDRYQNIGQMLEDLYGSGPLQTNVSPMLGAVGGGTPIAGAGAFAATNPTMQSMHLDPNSNSKTKKNNTPIIIGVIAVVAVILVVALVLIFGGKDDDEKTTEATTTEATTTEATTEEIVEDESYQWPTEMSDNWLDYTISIDGTIYQLPLPYDEFVSKGWKSSYLTPSVPANSSQMATFELGEMEASVYIINYGLSEVPVEECYVAAISMDPRFNNVDTSMAVELSKGVKMGSSTYEDVKKAFGAPDSIYQGERSGLAYTQADYLDDNFESGLDLEFNENEVLVAVKMGNFKVPEGIEVSVSDLDSAPPSINSNYKAPTGPSAELFDHIITINGTEHYKLPVPMSELIANGWVLDTATDDYVSGYDYVLTSMEKDGERIDIKLENFTADAINPAYAAVTRISVDTNYCSIPVSFPGGYTIGDDYSTFDEAYNSYEEEYSFDDSYESSIYLDFDCYDESIVGVDYLTVSAKAEHETGKLKAIEYNISVDTIE